MHTKKALLLINAVSDQPSGDEMDVLVQAEAVETALIELGYQCRRQCCDLNLQQTKAAIEQLPSDLVFNLVEVLEGKGSLIHLLPFMLESMRVPFTGSPGYALMVTTDKVRSKKMLRQHQLPTPDWYLPVDPVPSDPSGSFIMKPVWEDGSAGITDASVIDGNTTLFLDFFKKSPGKEIFLETFIDGREFNLSLLAGPKGPEVMPAAEMLFLDYPDGKPRILNYASKWEPQSTEYRKTVRSYHLSSGDHELVRSMELISLKCWELFELRGYARVDFRVDALNRPFVLEVNANPCIAPDAGFVAACAEGGVSYTHMIERIIKDM